MNRAPFLPALSLVGLALCAILPCLRLVASAEERTPDNDSRALRGTWSCTAAVIDGKPLADNVVKALRLTLTADRYKTERGDEILFDSTYHLDPRTNPKQIEMTGTEGDAAGKPALGIYALDGDTLKICYTLPGHDRPKDFASPPGSKTFLITWKRAASAKSPAQ
jgi:uncharacterized protein (TIGR03067 family)